MTISRRQLGLGIMGTLPSVSCVDTAATPDPVKWDEYPNDTEVRKDDCVVAIRYFWNAEKECICSQVCYFDMDRKYQPGKVKKGGSKKKKSGWLNNPEILFLNDVSKSAKDTLQNLEIAAEDFGQAAVFDPEFPVQGEVGQKWLKLPYGTLKKWKFEKRIFDGGVGKWRSIGFYIVSLSKEWKKCSHEKCPAVKMSTVGADPLETLNEHTEIIIEC